MENRTKLTGITAIMAMIMVVLVIGLGLAGCATYVPIQSVRPATINTQDIKRLIIREFQNRTSSSVGSQVAMYLSDKTKNEITTRGAAFFTIVGAGDQNADGTFSGELRRIDANDKVETYQVKDKNGNVRDRVRYIREVSIEFRYSVINARTNVEIGVVSKQGSASSYSDERAGLASVETLARRVVDRELMNFYRDIVPSTVNTNVKLMEETSSDKVVKNQMKMVKDLVKAKQYDEAIRQYDEIGSSAAKANASILRQAIESASATQAKMSELQSEKSGLVEKAVDGVIASINENLPAGSVIILMKTKSTNNNMLDDAMDQITKNVVAEKKITLVDRQNQTLINAEVQYQMSGNVSDDSFVSIGRQLGAQYIVLCWISGDMSSRRLNLRVLNIETSHIVDQKDFEI